MSHMKDLLDDERKRHAATKETVREQRFKLRSFGILLSHAIKLLPEDERGRIGSALLGLLQHIKNEHPLRFVFDEEVIEEP